MKKHIGVAIPHEEIWEEFISFVKNKWGKKHSMMGIELEAAIKKHIASEKENTHKKVPQKRERVKLSIGERRYLEAEEAVLEKQFKGMTEENIKLIIRDVVGLDPRTINKYFNIFCQRHRLVVLENDRVI